MKELIAKLEKASEGSRELDCDIPESLGWPVRRKPPSYKNPWCRAPEWKSIRTVPHYTTNIDAALQLVPEGFQWEVRHIPTDEGSNYSAQANWQPTGRCYAATPALALCIAALKARMAEEGRG